MWSRVLPRKTYVRLFLYACMAVCVLTLAFTMYLSRLFVQSTMNEIDASNRDKMQQVVQTSEFTLQKLRQFALRVYSEENIALWLNMTPDRYSPLSLYKAAASVREFVNSEPFIQSISLFNFKMNQIYASSDAGLYTVQDYFDPAMVDAIQSEGTTPYLQFFDHAVQGKSYLALVVPAAAGPNRNYSGYVSILFSKPLLNEHMLQISGRDQNKLIVENADRAFILGNADAELASALAKAERPASDAPSRKWTGGGGTWSIQTAELPIEGWKAYLLSPISAWQAKIDRIRFDIIAASVVLVFALLLFLYWQSYRRLKPISDLTARLQSKLGPEEPTAQAGNAGNEIAWLDSRFDTLVGRLEQQDLSLKSSKALIKDDLLRQWILGSKASGPAAHYIRHQTGILRAGTFRIAVIRLESYGRFAEDYDFASRKLLRYALGNLMAEVLANHDFAAETVDFGSDHIVALIAASAADEESRVLEAMKDVRAQIKRWLKLDLQAAVGPALGEGANLQPVYDRVYELTLLAFLCDEDRVFTMDDLERYRAEEGSGPDERLLKQAIHAVRLRNADALASELDSLTRHMHGLGYEECKLQLTHIIYSIMKSFKNAGTLQGMKSIHAFLGRFSTIGEVKAWLLQELLQMMDRERPRSGSARKEEFVSEMVEFVRNHLHNPMLSVDDIAEHVNLSVNYVRQIFKERYALSLSDYITDQRIKYAIHLLTTTDWTVADITEQSGFQTKSTFFSLFKRATGMTPGQYRQEQAKPER
ncbi:helix-turn-helix domain-containing protein [Paenibacillus sp. MWE-103]|uniref:Helix-turn-helix domain-containing protein n=1 Tax=Paenibacillus artemisiicola TaxID=1172618 RepID=A0ABS3W569_9BACL|nr:helix-turn-helix domain-containing protein [Paenibacillus artemisiicola]MBO7743435.1 helix-turn-helix domain-containing protein [Paenibacillus artemisiicola]